MCLHLFACVPVWVCVCVCVSEFLDLCLHICLLYITMNKVFTHCCGAYLYWSDSRVIVSLALCASDSHVCILITGGRVKVSTNSSL